MNKENKNNKNYEKALKQLVIKNSLLYNSSEFRLGKRVLIIKDLLMGFKLKKFFEYIKNIKRNRILYEKYLDKRIRKQQLHHSFGIPIESDGPSITIYTCIVGKYDMPKIPLLCYSNCHYVLYTDQVNVDVPGWEIRPLPQQVISQDNPTIKNRYLKFHPQEFFNTDYSIYIDGNVQLLTDISDMVPTKNSKTGIAMFTHPYRNCVYTEVDACIFMKKGNAKKLQEQITQYKKEGFPVHYGLNEATLIAVDLKNPKAKEILIAWWNEFIKSKSNRDQIALPYTLWKMGLRPSDIENLGEDIKQDLRLEVYKHNL